MTPEVPQCTCPNVVLNLTRDAAGEVWPSDDGREVVGRNWSEICAEHGVGTDYFKAMNPKPFGYAGEADTSREEFMHWLENNE